MLHQLELENFQGYKKASIKLSTGINVITGDNDEGKSSIIRALNYLGRNRPTRNNFINDSEPNQTLKITGTFDNGTVTRIKGKSKNEYVIAGEEPLKALKTEVPDEVQEITQLKDVNFQEQDNPYFLLSLTPGNVAKEINKVADLEVMDKLITSMKTEVSNAKQESSFWTEKHNEYKVQKEELKWVEQARDTFNKIRKLNADVVADSDYYNKVVDLVNTIADCEEKLEAFEGVEHAIKALKDIEKLEDEIQSVYEFRATLLEKRTALKYFDSQLSQYDNIDKAEKALKSIILLTEEISIMNYQKEKLTRCHNLISEHEKTNTKVEQAEKAFVDSLKKAGVCPLCETEF